MHSSTQTLSELSEIYVFNSYLSYIHAQDYIGTDDNMPDAFNDWLSEITDEDMIWYLEWFLRQLDKRIPVSINWWSNKQTLIPKIN